MYPGAPRPAMNDMMGGPRPPVLLPGGPRPRPRPRPRPCPPTTGLLLRLTASRACDASSSIALAERKSGHLLHHLMLILMEKVLLVGQCLNVLAHLLG